MKEYIVKGRLDNKTGFMSFTVKQELIRCKDCKFWRKSYFESVIGMVCNKTRYIMKPDDYCSMARAKEMDDAEKS